MPVTASALFGLVLLSPFSPAREPATSFRAAGIHYGALAASDGSLGAALWRVAPSASGDAPTEPTDASPTDPEPTDPEPTDASPTDTPTDSGSPDAEPTDSARADGTATSPDAAPDSPTVDGATADSTTAGPGPDDPKPDAAAPAEPAEPKDPAAMSLDDIFGTADTHTDVEVVSDAPATGETGPKPAAPKAAPKTPLEDKLSTRVRVVSSVYYDTARVEQRGFGRNENRLEFYFAYTPNKHIQIVGDVEPVFYGVAQTQALGDLASRQMLTPFHVESDAAYVAINDLLPKLDVKIGRQTVVWGTADKFNPTNNINPDDLEDRPLFTEPIANQMVVVDYAPLGDKLWFQGVYVPLFYPGLLPPSAADALKDPQTEVPFALEEDQTKIGELQALLDISPMLVPEVVDNVKTPRPRFSNGQSAVKMGTSLGGVDLSVSYYNGRHDIPSPVLADSSTKDFAAGSVTAECCFESEITLVYPRMQVVGFDFTTQLPFLGNMGLWGEGALFLPQEQELHIEFPINVDVTPDDGVANPVSELKGPTIRSNPYIKATAGADYSFGKHVYVQAQYLRGFIDEFGIDHIGNYVVGGTDLIFFGRHLIFRAFAVADIPKGGDDEASFVIFPEVIVVPPWGSLTFEIGSFFLIGGERTKFGQAAAGSSIAFFKLAGVF